MTDAVTSPRLALISAELYYCQLPLIPDEGDLLDTASYFLSEELGISYEDAQAQIVEFKETVLIDEMVDKLLKGTIYE